MTLDEIIDKLIEIKEEIQNNSDNVKGNCDSWIEDLADNGVRHLSKWEKDRCYETDVYVESLKEANKSIENASSTKYDIANKHIVKAVSYLSGKNKDPENSSKESVSAVEYLCNVLAGTNSFELSKAINALDKKKKLHPCMKSMIEKLYGFASDEEGIRHSTKDGVTIVSFEDALFILITCTAFINYAISYYN